MFLEPALARCSVGLAVAHADHDGFVVMVPGTATPSFITGLYAAWTCIAPHIQKCCF
jgi:hypothetical protein